MSVAFIVFFSSLVAFVAYARLCTLEMRRGHRYFLAPLRRALDSVFTAVAVGMKRQVVYIGRYVITLSWYYSLHTFLKLILRFLAGIYTMVETLLHHNRKRARVIRSERKLASESHLTALVDHKSETQLTEGQKQKRKDAALRGR